MGSFSMTCSVSGLGISVGTPVRCLLLTVSPYKDDDPRKTWIVRSPPIRAVYNDYGSIEDVHAGDDFIAKLWLRGLREDVIEKGLGDNACHDVPVAIDMSFEDMLVAIQEQRLQVLQDVKHFWMQPFRGMGSDRLHDQGLMCRVEALLESQFPGQVSRHAIKDKYVVDEPVPYMARVRFGEYQRGAKCIAALEAARGAVESNNIGTRLTGIVTAGSGTRLTGIVTAGSGNYANDADLLVFPLPASTEAHVVGPQWNRDAADNKSLRVGLAMIREDVWQALIAYPHCDYVALDCIECGESPSCHKKDRSCPTTSKKPTKDSKYSHGPVFPATVPHVIEPREWGEYVWYGIEAYKEGTRRTWEAACKKYSPSQTVTTSKDVDLMEFIQKERAKEETRIAALTPEERKTIEATLKIQQDAWEADKRRQKEHPFFGDFRIHVDHDDLRSPGAWVFHDSVPGVLGIPAHFSMLLSDGVAAPKELLDAVAELSAVQHVLGSVGVVLKPATASGPQYPEWGASMRFARTVLQIAEAAGKDRECEMPEPATLEEVIAYLSNFRKSKNQGTAKKNALPLPPTPRQEPAPRPVAALPRLRGKTGQARKWERAKKTRAQKTRVKRGNK